MTDTEQRYEGLINTVLMKYYQTPVISLDEYRDEDVARCLMQFYHGMIGYEACLILLDQYIGLRSCCQFDTNDLYVLRDTWLTFQEKWKQDFCEQVSVVDPDIIDEVEKARVCYQRRSEELGEEKWDKDHVMFNALNQDFWTNVCDSTMSWIPEDLDLDKYLILRLFAVMFRVKRQDLAAVYLQNTDESSRKRKRN